ncbi:putative holliday junction resolvase [Fulvimarina manganoxydans]|uniref:Putative pre-16S rRNA nuclease n=1 Tax=Fulvimarina manganoxydans TaxID=937218 RepID=A0A1W1ZYJ8_9HYPH|nr:Holliday junction resolvase RuvX [Fulvimarina manganoxydans]SMC53221.1 putative holliday junction resolvase [Fulvimarina manganoxydans]
MPVLTIEDFAEAIETGRPLAGLDLGTKTIGLAISDRSLGFAVPRPVIKRRKFTLDAEELRKALDKEDVTGIVLGLPLNMDGSSGPRAQSTKAFARTYGALDPRPMLLWDERLSTVAAERGLLEADVSRAKRATRIDSAAAAFILQGALDRLAYLFSAGSN